MKSDVLGVERSTVRAVAALLLPLVVLNGCYTFVPTQEVPSQGARVQVHLSKPQDVRLADVTANDVVLISGEVARVDSAALILSAYTLRSQSGYENIGRGESVGLLRENIAGIRRRKISPLNTAGLIAIGVALGVAVGVALAEAGNQGEGGGSPPVGL